MWELILMYVKFGMLKKEISQAALPTTTFGIHPMCDGVHIAGVNVRQEISGGMMYQLIECGGASVEGGHHAYVHPHPCIELDVLVVTFEHITACKFDLVECSSEELACRIGGGIWPKQRQESIATDGFVVCGHIEE
jgi:hypothetical protein